MSVITLNCVDMYYSDYHALKNISLDVKRGQIYSFLGPNGSGKTTTIKLILGLLKPSSGSVEVLGVDPYLDNTESLSVRSHIGSMLEGDGLYSNLTGMENLVYWAELYGLNNQKAHKNAVDVIKKVKLFKWADTEVSKYSHGMKKRLSFARALINDPDILVLDEPTSGVDPESRILIRNLMKNLVESGKTIFFSSHDLEEVQKHSPILSVLNNGDIIFTGTLEEFIHTFGSRVVFCHMNSPENANIKARRIQKFCTNIRINGSVLSFTPREYYEPNLKDQNIISSWTVENSLEEAYPNAISSNGRVDHE